MSIVIKSKAKEFVQDTFSLSIACMCAAFVSVMFYAVMMEAKEFSREDMHNRCMTRIAEMYNGFDTSPEFCSYIIYP